MTLGTIFKSVLSGPSTTRYYDHPAGNKLFVDRHGSGHGGEYYQSGHHHSKKGKSKSDKKHAILSALSLLAFLFFLNILQNCIREQTTMTTAPIMMFSQGKTQMTTEEYKKTEKRFRRNVLSQSDFDSVSSGLKVSENEEKIRKSRTLLQVISQNASNRQKKFITHLRNDSNWTNELTQISDKDLEEQKLKTSNFTFFYQKLKDSENSTKEKYLNLEKKVFPSAFRRLKKRERLTTREAVVTVTPNSEDHERNFLENHRMVSDGTKNDEVVTEVTFQPPWLYRSDHMNDTYTATASPQSQVVVSSFMLSDAPSTATNGPEERYNGIQFSDNPTMQTSKFGLNLDTYQIYPLPYYSNHRLGPANASRNQTYVKPETNTSYNDYTRMITEIPSHYPKLTYPNQSQHGRVKYRNKPDNHKGFFRKRNRNPARYRYSPHRRIGYHSANYYPVVVARYPDDDGFDLVKMAWSAVISLAKPLSKLVPGFGKDDSDDYQCYDLMVCEAQRASKYMGPTAETVATTLGTMLMWAVTEETRQIIVDAIKSGKENTCQQQIKDCEDRSGGKSAMTLIAQLLEMKLPS